VQQCNRWGSLNFGNYSYCSLYRPYCGAYCECKRAAGKADLLLVTIVIVRCTVCTVELSVSARGQQVKQTDCWTL